MIEDRPSGLRQPGSQSLRVWHITLSTSVMKQPQISEGTVETVACKAGAFVVSLALSAAAGPEVQNLLFLRVGGVLLGFLGG